LSQQTLLQIFKSFEEQLNSAVVQQRRASRASATADEAVTVESGEEASGRTPDSRGRRHRISGSDQPWVPRLESRALTGQEKLTSRRLVKILRYCKGRKDRSVEVPFDDQGYVSLSWLQDKGHIRRHEASSLFRILADRSRHLGGLPRFSLFGSLRAKNLRIKLQDSAPRPFRKDRRRGQRGAQARASSDSELSQASSAGFGEIREHLDRGFEEQPGQSSRSSGSGLVRSAPAAAERSSLAPLPKRPRPSPVHPPAGSAVPATALAGARQEN
jgi:hypothetical protein